MVFFANDGPSDASHWPLPLTTALVVKKGSNVSSPIFSGIPLRLSSLGALESPFSGVDEQVEGRDWF